MTRHIALVATICGLLTAVLFLLPLTTGALGLFVSTFAAAPLFVSALGFGTLAGILSGVVAAVAVAVFYGPVVAVALTIVTTAPAIWIGHLAGLSRDEGAGPEWYPASDILFRMALVAAATTVLFGWFSGYSPENATEQIRLILTQIVPTEGPGALAEADLAGRIDTMVAVIPFVFPVSVLFLLLLNFTVAERFARKRGWILRPREDYALTVGLPFVAIGVFAAAVALSFLPGTTGLAAQAVAGAMGGAFGVVGLATVHVITRTLPRVARAPSLVVTYFALVVSRFFAVALALLGLADTLLGLRARLLNSPNNPTPKD